MDKDEVRNYCLSKTHATSDFPFDQVTELFRLTRKMFALMGIDNDPGQINLKCDPPMGRDIREQSKAIKPGYHINKKYWNTINCQGNLPDEEIQKLVVKSLPKRERRFVRMLPDLMVPQCYYLRSILQLRTGFIYIQDRIPIKNMWRKSIGTIMISKILSACTDSGIYTSRKSYN